MDIRTAETRRSFLASPEMKDLTAAGYSIRSARVEHIPALLAIEPVAAQLLRGPCTGVRAGRDYRRAHARPRWATLDSPDGQHTVAFALVKMLADDLPHLEEIDVDPAHGRRGLGTALVKAVREWATDSGYA